MLKIFKRKPVATAVVEVPAINAPKPIQGVNNMKFNFLNFLAALVQTEQSALAIPVVAMSPAGRIIGFALIGEELAGLFIQQLHAQNAAAVAAAPAK